MSELAIKTFLDLLAQKMVSRFDLTIDEVCEAIDKSAIQQMIHTEPEYVNHVSIYDWAEEVYNEMFA